MSDTVRKRRREVLIAVIVLHLIAVVFGKDFLLTGLGKEIQFLCTLLRSYIYIFLFFMWGVYLQHRIVSKYTRRYLMAIAALIVLWMIFRTIKYSVSTNPTYTRMLWYLYYWPILFIPPFCVMVSGSVGKYEGLHMSMRERAMLVISGILFVLVLTNDFHQWMFVFPEDVPYFSDHAYSYGNGYVLAMGWVLCCSVMAVVILFSKCRVKDTEGKERLIIPLVPLILCTVYLICYASGAWITKVIFSDLTVCVSIIIVLTYESCIAYKLIPSNAQYGELFHSTELPVFIMDHRGQLHMASRAAEKISQENDFSIVAYKQESGKSIIINKRLRLSAFDIQGGQVYWMDDVSETIRSIEELRDVHEYLEQSASLAEEELRTNREKARLTESNRLYYEMQQETAGILRRMKELVDKLERGFEEEMETAQSIPLFEEEQEKEILGELLLLGAYFKRRNNLFFLEQSQQKLQGVELGYCFRESLAALELRGIKGSYLIDVTEEIPMSDAVKIYDCLESVLEKIFREIDVIAVVASGGNGAFQLTINISCADDADLGKIIDIKQYSESFRERLEVEAESENEFVITAYLGGDEYHCI